MSEPLSTPAAQGEDTIARLAAMGVQPERSETFHYQADGYASGWHAAVAAYRQALRKLPSCPAPEALPASGVEAVRGAIENALRRFGGIAVLARKPNALRFIADVAAREVAALTSAPAPEDRNDDLVRIVRLYCGHDKMTAQEKVEAIANHPYFAKEPRP